MRLSRPPRIFAALIALFSMLFMQLAVAAYACPAQEIIHAVEMADMMHAMPEMSDCTETDLEQPHLCHADAQSGHQSLDKPSVPDFVPFAPDVLAAAFYFITLDNRPLINWDSPPSLAKSTAPPIAIRNCCFRI